MARGQDLRRLINGVTLIAKEMAKRSEFVETALKGDLDHLISSSLKQLVVSATDLVGLTKGTVNEYSNSNPKPKETVVHFSNPPSPETSESEPVEEVRFSDSELRNDGEIRDSETVESIASHQEIPEVSAEVDSGNPVVAESLIRNDLEKDCEHENLRGEDGGREGGQVPMKSENRRRLRERPVPSTSFSRAIGFAGLAAGLAWGTIQESSKRIVYGLDKQSSSSSSSSPMLSEENAKRLALGLCRMRGAGLKVGQMLSIQDESLVPAPILAALDIVRQGADIMPRSQLNQVLEAELGPNWTAKLQSFDYEPIAAASIGQVHRAVTNNGLEVAMKIQYPGVANSIQSDINNVKLLLDYTRLIPKGLYLDRAMEVAKDELSQECDYVLEAMNQKRFRDLLSDSEAQGFYVPAVVDDISSSRVLTTELVYGIPIDKVALLTQETCNYVGQKLLELTLMELFVFRFMQTDPNWSNFLYDERTGIINLIDFGAAREYPKTFVDNYLRMVLACANRDRDTSIDMSRRLGFLTGMESEIMVDAHVQAGFVVGLPFSKQGEYDFRSTNIAQSISNLGGTMLRHRLTPPPAEAYSLHRKLSGAFLACIKLGAVVPCRELLLKVYEQYPFADDGVDVQLSSSLS